MSFGISAYDLTGLGFHGDLWRSQRDPGRLLLLSTLVCLSEMSRDVRKPVFGVSDQLQTGLYSHTKGLEA